MVTKQFLSKAVTGWSIFVIGVDLGRSQVISGLCDIHYDIILSPTLSCF